MTIYVRQFAFIFALLLFSGHGLNPLLFAFDFPEDPKENELLSQLFQQDDDNTDQVLQTLQNEHPECFDVLMLEATKATAARTGVGALVSTFDGGETLAISKLFISDNVAIADFIVFLRTLLLGPFEQGMPQEILLRFDVSQVLEKKQGSFIDENGLHVTFDGITQDIHNKWLLELSISEVIPITNEQLSLIENFGKP